MDVDGVAIWAPQTGTGGNWTQGTGSLKPDDDSGVLFDGIDDNLINSGTTDPIGTAYTCIWAVQFLACGTDSATWQNESFLGNVGGYFGIGGRSSNKIQTIHYDGAYKVLNQSVSAIVGTHIVGLRWAASDTTMYMRVNGNAWTSSATFGAPTVKTGIRMGLQNNSTYAFSGRVYYMAWSSDRKTEAEADDVFTFYNALVGAY